MVEVLLGLLVASVLLLPPAIKWELRMKWVIPWILFGGGAVGFLARIVWGAESRSPLGIVWQAIVIGSLSFAILMWRFFRDPERTCPQNPRAILSPADGLILYIHRFEQGAVVGGRKGKGRYSLRDFTQSGLFSDGATVIGIGMSFLDVHVNRAPLAGRVEEIRHIPGRFVSLKRPEAATLNERALTVIRTADGHPVGIVQIASRLVRRIVSYVKVGQDVSAGQRIGMIRFGSQVDLILPDGLRAVIRCSVGQQVYAGVSVLAERGE